MKIPIFPGKYHQNGGFSMAMLVYRRVPKIAIFKGSRYLFQGPSFWAPPAVSFRECNTSDRLPPTPNIRNIQTYPTTWTNQKSHDLESHTGQMLFGNPAGRNSRTS